MRRALALALLLGCEKAPPPPPPATPTAPAATPAKTDETKPKVDRKARYDGRPTVKAPPELPKMWRALPERLDAKLSAATHEVRTRPDPREEGYRRVEMQLRLFGRDVEVEARLLSAIGALKLPGATTSLPDVPIQVGPITWSLTVRRFVAPEGVAREAIATLGWERVPADPADLPRCRKPPDVAAPKAAPAWLVQRTKRTTSRRRVGATVEVGPDGRRVAMHVLYRNGETLTGEMARLAKVAAQRGLKKTDEASLSQTWTGAKGTLRWQPETGDLGLGCRIAGPVLRLEWTPG